MCTKKGHEIICSNSSNNDNTFEGKPSKITSYNYIVLDDKVAIWKATSHEGMLILDFENKRYSASQTILLNEGIVNKNCVGKVKKY